MEVQDRVAELRQKFAKIITDAVSKIRKETKPEPKKTP